MYPAAYRDNYRYGFAQDPAALYDVHLSLIIFQTLQGKHATTFALLPYFLSGETAAVGNKGLSHTRRHTHSPRT